jgi:vitamin B12 transporter
MRSPNTWPRANTRPVRLRAPAVNFIAKVKSSSRMNSPSQPGRLAARCLALLSSTLAAGALHAQSDPAPALDPYVVVATRTPADVRTLGTSVDLITADDLARQQITTPAAALGAIPGVPLFANGAPGSDVSVFTRGADSDQTLFLVDGIRLNDANTDYAVFLGGARLGATDTIEVARGPQSTLYGSEAVGGVVSIQAQKGAGAPATDLDIEAGSFGTVAGTVNSQGAPGPWAWSVSGTGAYTSNDRPNNAFTSGGLVLRLDNEVSPTVAVGATLRGFEGRFGDPGDIYTNDAYAHETESNWLGTVFVDVKAPDDWTAHLTVGGQDRRYVSFDEEPGVYASTTVVENHRGVVDYQATYAGLAAQKVTVGFTGEAETTQDDGYGDIDQRQTLVAGFAEDEWHPLASTYLTGGVRYDDFDTFGSAVTGRVTAAWLTPDRSLKFRASYGSGFNAPSFLELYGTAVGYQGDPNLRPERSRGGDAGFDWYLPNAVGTLSASWFRTDYRDLIDYDFSVYPGTTANIGTARTQGLELETKLKVYAGIEVHASYTYLDAQNLTDGIRLLRRPRNSGSVDLWRDFGHGWSAGAGVAVVADRQDVDAQTYETVADPNYAVARVYTAWKVTSRLTLQARLENALDQHYQPVNGYPALGLGAFGAVDWKL